jgi:hypothetical protein
VRRRRTCCRIDLLESNNWFVVRCGRVETVVLVDFGYVFRVCERNIHTLFVLSASSPNSYFRYPEKTYIVQRRPVLRQLNDLNRRIVTNLRVIPRGQRDLRQTERAIVLHIRRASDLEDRDGVVRVIQGLVVVPKIDVKLRS